MIKKQKSHSPLLLGLIVLAYLTNLFDLGFTLYALENVSHAFEMNPMIRLMLQAPWTLYLYKFVVIPFFMVVLYHLRDMKLARIGIWISAIYYTGNMIYQIWSIRLW